MKLSDLGEFKLIQDYVLPTLGRSAPLGDDCGWMDLGEGRVLLASTDAMVEDSDYQKRWMSGEELSQAIPPAYTEFIGKQLLAAM